MTRSVRVSASEMIDRTMAAPSESSTTSCTNTLSIFKTWIGSPAYFTSLS